MIENPDLKNLKLTCQAWLDEYDPDYGEDDMHHVYETAMETIFGKDVFKYLNQL